MSRAPHCGRVMPRLLGKISRRSDVREVQFDKIKGTLVDFNELEHLLDDMQMIGSWQIELRKAHNDPLTWTSLCCTSPPWTGATKNPFPGRLRGACPNARNSIRIESSSIPTPKCANFRESGKNSRNKRWSTGDQKPKAIPHWQQIPRKMKTKQVVVIAGVRTPFVKAGTSLAGVGAVELARAAILGVLARTAIDPAQIDEVILGCVAQPADAMNLARVAALSLRHSGSRCPR